MAWRTRPSHPLQLFVAMSAAATVTIIVMFYFSKDRAMPLVHKLEQPLLLIGAGNAKQNYLLPQGTSLYYDQAFPEGFVRFKVYINVEGVKLESRESTEQFWLDPLSAVPVDAANLPKLLKDYPLSKEDLAAILKSGKLSKEEIRQVLEEFSR